MSQPNQPPTATVTTSIFTTIRILRNIQNIIEDRQYPTDKFEEVAEALVWIKTLDDSLMNEADKLPNKGAINAQVEE